MPVKKRRVSTRRGDDKSFVFNELDWGVEGSSVGVEGKECL